MNQAKRKPPPAGEIKDRPIQCQHCMGLGELPPRRLEVMWQAMGNNLVQSEMHHRWVESKLMEKWKRLYAD